MATETNREIATKSQDTPSPSSAEESSVHSTSWWGRPCGAREVFSLAAPLTISWGLWAIMNLIDRTFLVWYSDRAAGAALSAGMLNWSAICLPFGLASYINTFVAQYHGAGEPLRVGKSVGQGVWMALCALPILVFTGGFAYPMFRLFGHSSEIAQEEAWYYVAVAPSGFFLVLGACLSSFFTGRGKTAIVMWGAIGAALTNVVLDYALIFGKWGFPEMGIFGAGVATSIGNGFPILIYLFAMWRERSGSFELAKGLAFDWPLFRRILDYATPSALPVAIEAMSFTFLVLMIHRLGELEGTANAVAFSVNGVAFAPMLGLGVAVSTLVGQHLGANRTDLATRASFTAMVLGIAYATICAIAYISMPELLLSLLEPKRENANIAELREMVRMLLRFVAAYCVFDAIQILFVSVLKGAGDTFFIMLATTGISVFWISVGCVLEQIVGANLFAWWWVITLWICTLGVVYMARFLQGAWKNMRVIEPDLIADESKG